MFASLRFISYLCPVKCNNMVNETYLRNIICEYSARRVDEEVDKLWESSEWDDEKNEAVLQEHLRTPYLSTKKVHI